MRIPRLGAWAAREPRRRRRRRAVAAAVTVVVLLAALAIGVVAASWLEANEDENAEIECSSRRGVEPGGYVGTRKDSAGRRVCVYLDRRGRTVTEIVLTDG